MSAINFFRGRNNLTYVRSNLFFNSDLSDGQLQFSLLPKSNLT